jgi:hypothetical protein
VIRLDVQEKENNFSFGARLFFQFCYIAKLERDHLQVDLAKFGYRPDMNVKQIQDSFLHLDYLLETVVEIWRLIYLFIYLFM